MICFAGRKNPAGFCLRGFEFSYYRVIFRIPYRVIFQIPYRVIFRILRLPIIHRSFA